MAIVDHGWRGVPTRLLGARCLLCRLPLSHEPALCNGCRADLPAIGRRCVHCAEHVPADSQVSVCTACRKRAHFDRAAAAGPYAQPLAWLISGLKFRRRRANARVLAALLADAVRAADLELPDSLVPVPLHQSSYRIRGFNQADDLARHLGRLLDIPVDARCVVRSRATARQSELSAARRAANVRGAFASRGSLAGAHVAIVDDVVTTTRTAAALAGCLRAAGASRVDLYCAARA